jgi:Protein of unknown function (DUF3574)
MMQIIRNWIAGVVAFTGRLPPWDRNLPLGSRFALALLVLAATGEAGAQPSECRVGNPQQVAELMFGRNIGDRIGVSEAAWARFVDREITPRFPDGLSVVNIKGQWLDGERKRIMREPSKLVIIVLPGKPEDEQQLGAIVEAYKKAFRQQSVGIILRPACVSF